MIFYHGTTEENWKRIQEEGILFGVRKLAKSRCTYLTTDINNYVDGCWQCRVYEPIALTSIIELLKNKK